ncbi:LysR family transcriptional regulator [Phreatobacter stygius]|uniref:LysR family transcriptional regulator n=1 Tax=Phreatobacter stygius TaxID=1940610 RepID=A0A4D7B0F3_9HYPH|nr:LysR family transcriptional regulator [Phreatobacter stygius]QCI67119.1 LysR family transcriptional regulator [Phreatobacter stygius]
MDWDNLRIALAVARHGSLSAAARALGTTQPTVSRRLGGFERRIGVKLFERAAGGLSPTPLCAALLDGLDRMDEGALVIERRIAARDTGLQGTISVTSLDWLGDCVVAPIVARFGSLHRLVSVELINDGRVFNLSRHEADIAFRFRSFEQEDLIERKVADIGYGLYAAPAYLERLGPPDFAAGCPGDAVVTLHEGAGRVCQVDWLEALAPKAQVILRANGLHAHLSAVEAGVALAALPRVLGDGRPGLRRLDTPLPAPVQAVRLGVHADLRDTPRIRAFIDFAASELKARAAVLNPA